MHESAFSYDDDKLAQQMVNGERVFDSDGSLAAKLQQTVRCGDPWNEGIVWPQLAEISLLGGLGCGKALLSLVIERLETMKPTAKQNYDYVVLQATENSVSFYESMGFVRVGALTIDDKFEKRKAAGRDEDDTESDVTAIAAIPVDSSTPADSVAAPSEIVSSPVTVYVVEKPGESPLEIAKKFSVSVWDIVFLNHYLYKDLNSRSRLMKGTNIFIPSETAAKADASSLVQTINDLDGESSAPRWYIASENETPRIIARKFGVNSNDLVRANIERLPELLPISRLKEGTRIKVSHFHLHEDEHVPYCHWTFPDDSFENSEPSYMMARKLNRRSAKDRPVQSSLAVPVLKYVRPPSSLFHVVTAQPKTPKSAKKKAKNSGSSTAEIPGKPKRPLSSYVIFCNENRDSLHNELAGKPASEYSKVLSARWKELNDKQKAVYLKKHEVAKTEYEKALTKYHSNLARFFEKHPEMRPDVNKDDVELPEEGGSLFNKVVTVKPGALRDSHKEYRYFYVLTYIPDLMWCHLVPMRQVGNWGPDKPKCEGRPIWMLVDESEGKEVDISASFCQPVKSRGVKRTVDADEEQWDIPGSGPPSSAKKSNDKFQSNHGTKTRNPVAVAVKKCSTKVKSIAKCKKRKREIADDSGSAKQGLEKDPRSRSPTKGKVQLKSDPIASDNARSPTRELRSRKGSPIVEDEVKSLVRKQDVASPIKTAPGKSATKRGKGNTNLSTQCKGSIMTRDLPRRKAAPSGKGIFSEAKSHAAQKTECPKKSQAPKKRGGRPPKNSSQRCAHPMTLSRPRRNSGAPTETLTYESTPSGKKMKQSGDNSAESTPATYSISKPNGNIEYPVLGQTTENLSKSQLKTLLRPLKEQPNSTQRVTRACKENTSPRPTKRLKLEPISDAKQLRAGALPLNDMASPYRRLPNRKNTSIFAETQTIGIASPLMMSRRLITS